MIGAPARYEYPAHWQIYAPGSGRRLSPIGMNLIKDICCAARDAVGSGVSLCIDHLGEGFLTADEFIRERQMLEDHGFAWLEDVLPWTDIEGHRKVADALLTPVAAGEDLYLWEGFQEAIETRAFDIIHPDMLSSGGLLETKRIIDHAERFGIPTALHACCSPVGLAANLHLAAATPSLLAVENHNIDFPFLRDLVHGLPLGAAPNYTMIPNAPGLGIELNEDAIRRHLRKGTELFAPTDDWNTISLGPEWVPQDLKSSIKSRQGR